MAGDSEGREQAEEGMGSASERRLSVDCSSEHKCGFSLFLESCLSGSCICPFLFNQHWRQEGLDVKTMMNTWTLQKGFPLITVTVRGRNVHMKQEHYMKGSDTTDTG